MKTINMRYERWVREFEPLKNHLHDHMEIDGHVFMPHGKDWDFVHAQPDNRVWTFFVSDEGRKPVWVIGAGLHVVNRMGYLVTRKPFDDTAIYCVIY